MKRLRKLTQAQVIKMGPKRFIEDHLIPFMLRDAGRGFAMQTWRRPFVGASAMLDDITHHRPSCGTVACVGGSICCLVRGLSRETTLKKFGALLGISEDEVLGLFHRWGGSALAYLPAWPESDQRRFASAKTPCQKARVAVKVLREAVRTKGESLRTWRTR